VNGVVGEVGDCIGGLHGAFEIAAVERVKGFVFQTMGNGLGLLLAAFVEGNGSVALDAPCGIPFGFTVAYEDQFGHDTLMIELFEKKTKICKCAGFIDRQDEV
jgi:hypothetical protein